MRKIHIVQVTLIGLGFSLLSCRSIDKKEASNSKVEGMFDDVTNDVSLPTTVGYQWSCSLIHSGTALPPGSRLTTGQTAPSDTKTLKIALVGDTFYMDATGQFQNDPTSNRPDLWGPTSFGGAMGFRRYKMKFTLSQKLAIDSKSPQAPALTFANAFFGESLASGSNEGTLYAIPVGKGQNDQETYLCKSDRWWPLAPMGW